MPKRCALGCLNNNSYHQFPHPERNPDRFKAWVHIVGGKLDGPADYELYKKKVICDIHFTERDRNRNNRLNFLAVPSLHLSGKSDEVGISEKVLLVPETEKKESLFFIYMQPETNLQTAKNSPSPPPSPKMSKRTGFPTTTSGLTYRGLVENMSIPAELHERPDGKPYASFGSTVPIHCCTPEQVEELAKTTHHYCDIFTEQLLAPLGELVYVRIDENTAEKVFINRSKRLLLRSSDGCLAQWRLAPTFESANAYVAGTPIATQAGDLVSVVTAKRGNHYAVSTFEGEGGYFETTESWKVRSIPEGAVVYGDKTFSSREELRSYVSGLPAPGAAPGAATPILYVGHTPRIVLVAKNGRQISHQYLHGVITTEIDYL